MEVVLIELGSGIAICAIEWCSGFHDKTLYSLDEILLLWVTGVEETRQFWLQPAFALDAQRNRCGLQLVESTMRKSA
jgi:hypothetical protein